MAVEWNKCKIPFHVLPPKSLVTVGEGGPGYWDRYWRGCDDYHKLNTALVDYTVKYAKPGGLVLDAGSGPGVMGRAFEEKGFRVVDLDYAAVPEGGCIGDVLDLPFRDETFDVYFSAGMLGYFPVVRLERLFAEADRVTRVGGRLVFSFSFLCPPLLVMMYDGVFPAVPDGAEVHSQYHDLVEIYRLVKGFDWRVVNVASLDVSFLVNYNRPYVNVQGPGDVVLTFEKESRDESDAERD